MKRLDRIEHDLGELATRLMEMESEMQGESEPLENPVAVLLVHKKHLTARVAVSWPGGGIALDGNEDVVNLPAEWKLVRR